MGWRGRGVVPDGRDCRPYHVMRGGRGQSAKAASTGQWHLFQTWAAMSPDDPLQVQIQHVYQAYLKNPGEPLYSVLLGKLYEQAKDSASALTWFESARKLGHPLDAGMELRLINLRLKSLANDIDIQRQALASEASATAKEQLQTHLTTMLDELNTQLGLKKELERRSKG